MVEYISRDEALNFEAEISANVEKIQAITEGMALYAEHIKAIPAEDVVPVVRCRDCEHYEADVIRMYSGVPVIMAHCVCHKWGAACQTNPDGYCHLGKQKYRGKTRGYPDGEKSGEG